MIMLLLIKKLAKYDRNLFRLYWRLKIGYFYFAYFAYFGDFEDYRTF